MIDKLKVSRVVNAELQDCHALVSDIEGYETWVSDLREVAIENRDDKGRVTEATFRVAAMGRSATYSLAYDHSEAPSVIRWELVTGDILKRLDGSYRFENVPDEPRQTEVVYELALELAIPLPGFVKRRAEGRIAHAALDDLQAQLEG
ncbi:MAG: SRPBCC family protein [Actinomycetota bacterium]|nr:SRPBCC family protein [Acidimicrobiales bacterium]MED5540694.1 SRPBCC family protein [Actinomycetota bacterium]